MRSKNQIRRCPRCEQFRHITWFDSDFGICFECRQTEMFGNDNREWLDDIVRSHEVDLRDRRSASGVRENYALDRTHLADRQARIAVAIEKLLEGSPPHGVTPKAWRITQARIDGRLANDVATEEMTPRADVERIERETMQALYKIAEAGLG